MDKWPAKLKLLSVLSTTYVLLQYSAEEGWPEEKPVVAAYLAERIILCLLDSTRDLPDDWQILFAPTGPAQEISMANGWHEAYMKLAEEFDELAFLLKDRESSDAGKRP
jgi:hypothetical protein